MNSQVIIRLDKSSKEKLISLAGREGKNVSEIVRNLIDSYIKSRDITAYINDLWVKIGADFKSKGVKQTTIQQAIRNVRKVGI